MLAVKSMLDGFAAMAFASVLGWGVGFSALTVLVYQGALTGIGLRLLDLRRVRVANLLPALVLAPSAVAVIESFR